MITDLRATEVGSPGENDGFREQSLQLPRPSEFPPLLQTPPSLGTTPKCLGISPARIGIPGNIFKKPNNFASDGGGEESLITSPRLC